MKCSKSHLCFVSLVALVALRVAIGWHFFSEGLKHTTEPGYTEGFLKQAKGPLAEYFQSPLPTFHDWTAIMLKPAQDTRVADAEKAKKEPEKVAPPKSDAPQEDENDPKVKAAKKEAAKEKGYAALASHDWVEKAAGDWLVPETKIAAHYGFSDAQKEQVKALHMAYRDKLYQALAPYDEDIRAFRHNEYRLANMKKVPGSGDVPNMKARVEAMQKDPAGEKGSGIDAKPVAWQSDAQAIELVFLTSLDGLATKEQRDAKKDLPSETTAVQKQEKFITYSLIAFGACLVVGFLTPLASLGGAVFLLSVMATQPFWVPGAVNPVAYYQAVEIFALLFLAVSGAGRFAGLDFFLSCLFGRCCSAKGDK